MGQTFQINFDFGLFYEFYAPPHLQIITKKNSFVLCVVGAEEWQKGGKWAEAKIFLKTFRFRV